MEQISDLTGEIWVSWERDIRLCSKAARGAGAGLRPGIQSLRTLEGLGQGVRYQLGTDPHSVQLGFARGLGLGFLKPRPVRAPQHLHSPLCNLPLS